MAPLKAVKSLKELSLNSVAESLKAAFINMEDTDNSSGQVTQNLASMMNNLELDSKNNEEKMTQLKKYFEGLPVAIQEKLADQLLKLGHPRITKYTCQILTDERTIGLHIRNLSIRSNDDTVKNCLMRTTNLKCLTLDYATDETIETIGKYCRELTMLKISGGDFTEERIHWITPTTDDDNNEYCINNQQWLLYQVSWMSRFSLIAS